MKNVRYGLCVMKDVVEVRNENLKRQMKNEDDKRKKRLCMTRMRM